MFMNEKSKENIFMPIIKLFTWSGICISVMIIKSNILSWLNMVHITATDDMLKPDNRSAEDAPTPRATIAVVCAVDVNLNEDSEFSTHFLYFI